MKLFVWLTLAFALLIGGCQSAKPLILGEAAPDFTLTDLNGHQASLRQFLPGDKEVLLNFWASWCPGCREELPSLNDFASRYADVITIVGVNLQEQPDVVAAVVKTHGLKYPQLLDKDGRVTKSYGVTVIPRNVLINKDGLVTKLNLDIREMASYLAQLKRS